MLVRRLRGAVGSTALQCIGTSATLAGPGTRAEQRQQVAELATRLFGTPIPAGQRRRRNAAPGHQRRHRSHRAGHAPERRRPHRRGKNFNPTRWRSGSKRTFGLDKDDEGRLARQSPTRLSDAVETAESADRCRRARPASVACGTLLLGRFARSVTRRSDIVRVQAAPVHRQGRHRLRHSGNRARARYLTTHYQRSAPVGEPGAAAVPAGVLPRMRPGLPGRQPRQGR